MAKIKKVTTLNAGDEVISMDHTYTADGHVGWLVYSGHRSGNFL